MIKKEGSLSKPLNMTLYESNKLGHINPILQILTITALKLGSIFSFSRIRMVVIIPIIIH